VIGNFLSHFSISINKSIEEDFDKLYNLILLDPLNFNICDVEEVLSWFEFKENYERCKTLNDIIKNESKT
jgi:hypothetical protein